MHPGIHVACCNVYTLFSLLFINLPIYFYLTVVFLIKQAVLVHQNPDITFEAQIYGLTKYVRYHCRGSVIYVSL